MSLVLCKGLSLSLFLFMLLFGVTDFGIFLFGYKLIILVIVILTAGSFLVRFSNPGGIHWPAEDRLYFALFPFGFIMNVLVGNQINGALLLPILLMISLSSRSNTNFLNRFQLQRLILIILIGFFFLELFTKTGLLDSDPVNYRLFLAEIGKLGEWNFRFRLFNSSPLGTGVIGLLLVLVGLSNRWISLSLLGFSLAIVSGSKGSIVLCLLALGWACLSKRKITGVLLFPVWIGGLVLLMWQISKFSFFNDSLARFYSADFLNTLQLRRDSSVDLFLDLVTAPRSFFVGVRFPLPSDSSLLSIWNGSGLFSALLFFYWVLIKMSKVLPRYTYLGVVLMVILSLLTGDAFIPPVLVIIFYFYRARLVPRNG